MLCRNFGPIWFQDQVFILDPKNTWPKFQQNRSTFFPKKLPVRPPVRPSVRPQPNKSPQPLPLHELKKGWTPFGESLRWILLRGINNYIKIIKYNISEFIFTVTHSNHVHKNLVCFFVLWGCDFWGFNFSSKCHFASCGANCKPFWGFFQLGQNFQKKKKKIG